jgi:hypothetical protein
MWDGTGAQGVDVTSVNATAQGMGSSTEVGISPSRVATFGTRRVFFCMSDR